jgi:hypothetical protein
MPDNSKDICKSCGLTRDAHWGARPLAEGRCTGFVLSTRHVKTHCTKPAFPTPDEEFDGLSKREYFAAKAMQGMLAAGYHTNSQTVLQNAQDCVEYADALIEALEKE